MTAKSSLQILQASKWEIWNSRRKTDLRQVNLEGADLTQIENLSKYDLSGAQLSHANLQGIEMNRANLEGCLCLATNFSHCNLTGAKLNGAHLRNTNLDGANFSSAEMKHVEISENEGEESIVLPIA